jgi:hypothetical protein
MGAFIVMGVLAVLIVAGGVFQWWNYRRVARLKASGDFVPMSMAARVVIICIAVLFIVAGLGILH